MFKLAVFLALVLASVAAFSTVSTRAGRMGPVMLFGGKKKAAPAKKANDLPVCYLWRITPSDHFVYAYITYCPPHCLITRVPAEAKALLRPCPIIVVFRWSRGGVK